MVKEQTKKSTIISLSLHLGIIVLLLIFNKPISILVPSRSDGMEVSLVTMPNRTVTAYTPKIKVSQPEPIVAQDKPADINVKDNNKQPKPKPTPQVTTPPKPLPVKAVKPEKPVEDQKTEAPTPPVNTKAKPQKSQKVQVNDLLGDAMSNSTTAVRKGKALGGNPNGTSDSNNLIGNYADQVINAVRPFVIIPDDINPSAKAIVKVTLNPDLSVRQVSLLKSSGNPTYDQNIQDAINRVKVFPPLPDGAKYVDYRILKLTFRPQ